MARDEDWDKPLVGVPRRGQGPAARTNRVRTQVAIARIHARMGREEKALRHLERVIPAIEQAPVWAGNYTYSMIVCDAAETLWLTRRREHVEAIERALREKVLPADFRQPMTDCRSALARLCALQGRHDEAVAWFAQARAILDEQGARPLHAVVDYDEGVMYMRRHAPGDRELALPLLEAALGQFRAIGMPGWIRRAESLLRDNKEWSPQVQGADSVAGLMQPSPRPSEARPFTSNEGSTASLFRKDGDYWTISYRGTVVRLRDGKGLQYLAQLLRHPSRELLALDLAQGAAAADLEGAGPAARSVDSRPQSFAPLLDADAKSSYRHRVDELRGELAEAERNDDIGRTDRIRAEMEMLAAELRAAVGIGGRDRRAGDHLERARSAVGKRIRTEIKRISTVHPSLGRDLRATVTTGYFCRYAPEHDVIVRWDL